MKGRAQFACFAIGLLAVLGLFASSAEASVSVSMDISSIKADPFASLPQLTSKPIAERLAAVEQNDAGCVALCELAASIDADPFGYGVKPRPFGGRATPFGRQYQYANANPTFYVDPTGHIVRQINDKWINDAQDTSAGASSGLAYAANFAGAFAREAAFQAWDRFSFGALSRQDKLVDQNLEGKITDTQYRNRTAANVALTGAQAALTVLPGGTAATATRAIVTGAASGVVGQGLADVGEIYGTKTKSIDDVRATDYLFAAGLGSLSGGGGRGSRGPSSSAPPRAIEIVDSPGSRPIPAPSGAAPGRPALVGDPYSPGSVWRRQVDFENQYLDWTSRAKQEVGKPPAAKVLRSNLEALGAAAPARASAAHHIVAGREPAAAQARAILGAEGIDINEAANGLFLPSSSRVAQAPVLTHSRIHTTAYYAEVTRRMVNAQPGTVREVLRGIASDIAAGNFPR